MTIRLLCLLFLDLVYLHLLQHFGILAGVADKTLLCIKRTVVFLALTENLACMEGRVTSPAQDYALGEVEVHV